MKDAEKINKDKTLTHPELIDKIYDTIFPYFQHIFIENNGGVNNIQIFNEKELIENEQNRFKITNADMLVLDEKEKPLLVIVPETSASPKTFGRSIPIYTIAQKVRVKYKNIEKPIDLKGSSLKDFAICQDDVLKPTLKRFFFINGYDEYGCYFK